GGRSEARHLSRARRERGAGAADERFPSGSAPDPSRTGRGGCYAPPMRWWTLALIGIGTALGLVWIWALSDGSRQAKVTSTGAVGFGAGLLSFLWLLVLSGLPLRTRLLVVLGAGALLALAFLGLEIRGVTGDLVPIVGLRGGGSKLEATVAPASSRSSA